MKKILLLTIALLFISAITRAGTIKNISFSTVDKGTYSPVGDEKDNKQRIVEIYNQEEWKSFWEWHKASLKRDPAPELPEINFNDFIVIVAIDQIRGNGGYSLEIKNVSIDKAFKSRPFKISIEIKSPGSAQVTPSVMTRPYHIVKIKK